MTYGRREVIGMLSLGGLATSGIQASSQSADSGKSDFELELRTRERIDLKYLSLSPDDARRFYDDSRTSGLIPVTPAADAALDDLVHNMKIKPNYIAENFTPSTERISIELLKVIYRPNTNPFISNSNIDSGPYFGVLAQTTPNTSEVNIVGLHTYGYLGDDSRRGGINFDDSQNNGPGQVFLATFRLRNPRNAMEMSNLDITRIRHQLIEGLTNQKQLEIYR